MKRLLTHKIVASLLLTLLVGSSLAQEQTLQNGNNASPSLLQKMGNRVGDVVSTTSSGITSVLNTGLGYLGVPYRFGGTGPLAGGFDCSGLIKKVFGDAIGMSLPRTAAEMAQVGEKVGRQDLKPGDLVFFNTMNRTFSHAGIYLGENKFIHAPSTGSVVRIDNMEQDYWSKRFTGARRLLVSDVQAEPLQSDKTGPNPRPSP